MNTTLTLNVEESIVEQAEIYASAHNISLPKLIENYLKSLAHKKEKTKSIIISPLVESLTGVIPSEDVDNYKQEYQNYLIKKYV
jgi:hypothetical protein